MFLLFDMNNLLLFLFCHLVHGETPLNTSTNSVTTTTATTATNGDSSQRRVHSVNRQQLNETICRLSKPKTSTMTQSVHLSALSPHRISSSQSTHQFRSSTPTTPSTPTTSMARRVCSIRIRGKENNRSFFRKLLLVQLQHQQIMCQQIIALERHRMKN